MSTPAPSPQDLYNIALVAAVSRRTSLRVLDGDITDAMLWAIAAAADACIRQGALDVMRTFFSGAKGEFLDQVIVDRIKLERHAAAKSVGTLSVSRPSAGGGEPAETFDIGDRVGTAVDASGGQVQVEFTEAISFAAGELGPKTAAARSLTSGLSANTDADTLTSWIDAPDDPSFVVTNPEPFAGGADAESDESYLARARDFYAALRRATMQAIEYAARLVPQVVVATATESATGLVTVYVADADGNSNAEMVSLVDDQMEAWRALGAAVEVAGGSIFLQDVDVSATAKPGARLSLALIQAAVTGRLAKLGSGETLELDMIKQAIIALDPDRITSVQVNTPAASVEPEANQIIRAGAVTAS